MTINNSGDMSIMSNFVSTCKNVYVRSTTPISTKVNISGTLHLPKGYVEFFKSKGWSATKIVDDLNINMSLGSGTFGNITWDISLDSTLVISSSSYGGAKMTSSYTTNDIVEYTKYPWYNYRNKVKHVVIKNLTSIGEQCLADMYYLEDVTTNTTKVSLAGGKYTDELFYCFGAGYEKEVYEGGGKYTTYYKFKVPSNLSKIVYTGNIFSLSYFSGGISTFRTSYSNGTTYYNKTSEFHPTKPFEIHANNVTEYKQVYMPALRNTKLYLTYTGELTSRMFQDLCDLYSLSINGTGIASENGAFYTLFGIATYSNMDMMYGGGGFYIPKNLKEVHLLEGVTSIPQDCFMNVTSLEKVYLPSTLRGVQDNAFYNCDGLTDIVVNASLPPSAKDNTFDGVNLFLCKLHVPSDSKKYYSVARGWKEFFFMEEDAEDVGKEKCVAPVVNYSNGKITCNCATANAVCHYTYAIKGEGTMTGDVDTKQIEITAYAEAEGFAKSEMVTKTFDYVQPVNCDINGDGKVTMADANAIVNMVLSK